MLARLGDVGVDRVALALEVTRDGGAKAAVLEPVRRERARRLEAARDLVLALRAGVEEREPALDAVLDALVVAGLEVQRILVSGRAPVAAVEPAAALEEDRCGDAADPSRSASLTMTEPGRARETRSRKSTFR